MQVSKKLHCLPIEKISVLVKLQTILEIIKGLMELCSHQGYAPL